MVDKGFWKEKDFSKVPCRAIYEKYQCDETMPMSGSERNDYRLQNRDLDNWLVLAKGLKPAQIKDIPAPKPTPVPKTTPTPVPPKTTPISAAKNTSAPKTTTTTKKTIVTGKKASLQDKAKEAQAMLNAIKNMQSK
jgi:hypothetical protein